MLLQLARSIQGRGRGASLMTGQCSAASPTDAVSHRPPLPASAMASAQGEQKQVTLRLTTRMPAPFRVAAHPLAVPARLTRFGLSEVVNSLLKLGAL